MTLVSLLVIALLVVINGFFVAAEFALVSLRPERLGASKAAQLARRQSERMDEYLSACQLGITIASLALGALGEPTIAGLIEPVFHEFAHAGAIISTVIALLLMTALHITIGEQAPKSFAIGSAAPVATLCAYPLNWFFLTLRPLVLVLNAVSNGMVRMLGGTPATGHGGASLEELRLLVGSVADSGELDQSDSRILQGLFTIDERHASDIMTSTHRLTSLETDQTVAEALVAVRETGHSRFPLVEPDSRTIAGMVTLRDLAFAAADGRSGERVSNWCQKIPVVPRAMTLDRLLARLQEQRVSMCAVLDEYGELDGIVTVEDVVEEIVGEIWDENDVPIALLQASDGSYVVAGDTLLADLSSEGIELPTESRVDSVGGLVQHLLGELPERGARVEHEGRQLEVLELDGHRILKVRITPLLVDRAAAADDEEDDD